MALYRCKVCGSPKVVQTTQTGGITYNFAKGLVGQAVFGLGGAVAGLESKTETVYACPDCGAVEKDPMVLEIKLLIDVGVMSAEARKNLVLYGAKLDWDVLKETYPGIESGFGDQTIEAQKQQYRQILSAKATASREEFDQALEDMYMFYEKQGYWSGRRKELTAEDCAKAYAGLNVFVENLSKFYSGAYFTSNQERSFKYKDLSWPIGGCLLTYLCLKYYREFGIPVFAGDKNVLRFLYDDPFIQAFLREYEYACKLGGCWSFNQREDRYMVYYLLEHGLDYFVQWFYANFDDQLDQLCISVIYPKYLYDDKEVYETAAEIDEEKVRAHIDRYKALLPTKAEYEQKIKPCRDKLDNIATRRRNLWLTASNTEYKLKRYRSSGFLRFFGKKKIAALEAELKRIEAEKEKLAAEEAETKDAIEKWKQLIADLKIPEIEVLALQIAKEQNYFLVF